ncbi:hypothetical protein BH09CHL1_BH09CHL1_07070 [soil metagenome]
MMARATTGKLPRDAATLRRYAQPPFDRRRRKRHELGSTQLVPLLRVEI